uniref:IgGFc-binding protein n=1 Tax=Labilibaculum sp. TaxID=2060723 RepID=UPI0035680548
MKKFLLVFISLFSILFLKVELVQAQVDSLHYLPPMCSFTNSSSNVKNHRMVLTTSESTAFTVTITNNDGSFVKTVSLSSSSPKKVDLDWPKTILESQGIIGTGDLNTVLDTEGLIVSGSKKFFVNVQNVSTAQGDLLTSKGTTGLGTDFYSGHMYSQTGGYDDQNGHFIGVMATENNTNITFSNPRVIFTGQTSNTFTISLNKGQSVVIGISIVNLLKQTSNLNDVNGTHITSNKPIAVSSGSMCASGYGNRNPGRDVGFDQLVPTDVVGDEYILIKGEGISGGAQYNEKALVVATEDNTNIYLNGSSTAETTLNQGEYYFTDYTDFGTNKNLYIRSDKNIFCYQTLSGANKKQTAGFCFIPPLKCTADKEVTIAYANKLSTLTVSPILKLVSQEGSTITINGSEVTSFNKSVAGNTYWETYDIPEATLANHLDSNGDYNFEIVSTGALNAMLAVESNNVGGGGYFSGFGDVPQIEQNPEIESEGLCGDN